MQCMKMEKIKFLPNHIIEIELTGSKIIQYDMTSKLKTGKFKGLQDKECFEAGKLIENSFIQWNSIIQLHDYEILGKNFIIKNFKGIE